MTLRFTSTLKKLDLAPPFLGPTELERRRGRPYRARLGANEGLFGASPAALAALRAHEGNLSLYADPTHRDLRRILSQTWGLRESCFVIAGGIEGLLDLVVRAFVEPGDVAVTSLGAFIGFDYFVRASGGRLVHVPYAPSFANDLEALVQAVQRHHAKLLYLANPDNPTGTQLPPETIETLLSNLPADCLLLLDEAYVEFAATRDVLPRSESRPNLIRMRSLSKAFGLASARVGYACADSSVIVALDRIRIHFAVSGSSQAAALAALEDEDFLAAVVEKTKAGREHYASMAEEMGVACLPSSANFVAFDFGTAERAQTMAQHFEENDVFVVRPSAAPLNRLVRVTVGTLEARELFFDVWRSAKQGARS